MSIQSEINRIKGNVAGAYSSVERKGGAMPEIQSSDKLAAAIESIPIGITGEHLQEALSGKQDLLTGTPGQVVGFDAKGEARAVPGWSNPNLLDNWYFGDPVNQRGQTEYSVTGVKYTIDRWLLSQETTKILRIVENGISIEPKAVFVQKLEPGCIQDGSQITMSVMINHMVFGASLVWDSAHGYTNLTSQYGFRLACDPLNRYVQIFNESGLGEDVINAVKLELGTQQTLARQDADGSWVLNDPPPNKALELAKCQRYQLMLPADMRLRVSQITSTYVEAWIPTPGMMRVLPALPQDCFAVYDINGIPQSGFTFENFALSANGFLLRAQKPNHGLTDAQIRTTKPALLDANL